MVSLKQKGRPVSRTAPVSWCLAPGRSELESRRCAVGLRIGIVATDRGVEAHAERGRTAYIFHRQPGFAPVFRLIGQQERHCRAGSAGELSGKEGRAVFILVHEIDIGIDADRATGILVVQSDPALQAFDILAVDLQRQRSAGLRDRIERVVDIAQLDTRRDRAQRAFEIVADADRSRKAAVAAFAGQRLRTAEEGDGARGVDIDERFKPDSTQETRAKYQYLARGNSLFRNRGSNHYDDVSETMRVTMGRWSWASLFVDLNNDSWEDLLVTNGFITGRDTEDL